jgi:ADP-ribosylglycohydrolase
MTACAADDDHEPNPHSMALATQVALPKAAESMTIKEASKKSYSFQIMYPYNPTHAAPAMASDATNVIRTLLRKLVEDGQKPHDQETEISVWALAIKPGKIGESGHQFDSSERYFIWASYDSLSDSIKFEECTEDSTQWRSGHCS